ncbi:MAG: hypothetical protein IPK06_02810 [Ignavibacteriae bacterium]|nr:hypothetical protein [Ignavibacteriota bacterium]
MDAQASNLINSMTDLESKVQSVSIDLAISKSALDQYKSELRKQDMSVSKYLESKANEPFLLKLQEQIAEIEAQKEFAKLGKTRSDNKDDLIKQYDNKILTLRETLGKKRMNSKIQFLPRVRRKLKLLLKKYLRKK